MIEKLINIINRRKLEFKSKKIDPDQRRKTIETIKDLISIAESELDPQRIKVLEVQKSWKRTLKKYRRDLKILQETDNARSCTPILKRYGIMT